MKTLPLRKTNLAEQAYGVIHRLLLDGGLAAPGDKISVEDLARRMGVSRSPVWAAIARLEAERIVEVRPRQGVFFVGFDRDRLMQIFAAREVLEGSAARLAAQRADPKVVAQLRRSIDLQRAAIGPDREEAYKAEAARFHKMVADLSGNVIMAELIDQLWARTQAMCIRPDVRDAILDARVDEHGLIVDAIAAGDGDRAEAETRSHIRRIASEVYALVPTS